MRLVPVKHLKVFTFPIDSVHTENQKSIYSANSDVSRESDLVLFAESRATETAETHDNPTSQNNNNTQRTITIDSDFQDVLTKQVSPGSSVSATTAIANHRPHSASRISINSDESDYRDEYFTKHQPAKKRIRSKHGINIMEKRDIYNIVLELQNEIRALKNEIQTLKANLDYSPSCDIYQIFR